MITLEEGAKRHEKLFPNADLLSQVYKLEEELMEFDDALMDTGDTKQMIKELADCFIVCWGIYRFAPSVANLIESELMDFANPCFPEIMDMAEKKWLINEGRTWVFDGKVYKHVGKDGNE